MDNLLKSAQVLYRDRQRIALAAFIVLFTLTAYVLFGPISQSYIADRGIPLIPGGWTFGTTVVYGFSTVVFILAFSVMVFFYAAWSWAFLPSPATVYTLAVLRGIFGTSVEISRRIGKQFRVHMRQGLYLDFQCRIRGAGPDEWFVYRVRSSPIVGSELQEIALRNGFHIERDRFVTSLDNEELHSRTILLARAIAMISIT